ncbi:sialate O-acetylesterase [Paraglaciecola sp. L3A3]|uniref:sialate O-acetylesterase n=1 Tax=Paraglaciecola sp. L3A3 TaxID=2686358 RepID=UPI00131BE9D7|nr:sialate O-acetylesterase [Paraglaciecola sp. L3A3]
MKKILHLLFFASIVTAPLTSQANIVMPNIFGDNMVIQQLQKNTVWGKADSGEKVNVSIAGQSHITQADSSGNWRVSLNPIETGSRYQLSVSGKNQLTFNNVAVGEVWVCAGQSNMGWRVGGSNHSELEIASANYRDIRLITVPRVGVNKPQFNFDANWQTVSADTVAEFSATCYFFGRRLHKILDVPVGLINSTWGGSPIEAFISRDALSHNKSFMPMLAEWDRKAAEFTPQKFSKALKDFAQWEADGQPGQRQFKPDNVLTGKKRPANIFNGVINPIVGYGMKGVIWCQGESNLGRGYQYRSLFPLLINSWRESWGQGDFPFYWVQLADFNDEVQSPSAGSSWAELREAQTLALELPNTGQAIVIDLGEAKDIHPRNKQEAANRLVRHPLLKDYGYQMAANSPMYDSFKIIDNKVQVTFKDVSSKLYSFDTNTVLGFYIAGKDQRFVNAQAKIIGKNKIEVFAKSVSHPVAVRYGWENNPVVNLYDKIGLPVTPFRTDTWPLLSQKQQ